MNPIKNNITTFPKEDDSWVVLPTTLEEETPTITHESSPPNNLFLSITNMLSSLLWDDTPKEHPLISQCRSLLHPLPSTIQFI